MNRAYIEEKIGKLEKECVETIKRINPYDTTGPSDETVIEYYNERIEGLRKARAGM